MKSQNGSLPVILTIVFGLLFIVAAVTGTWAFTERQKYKNDADTLVNAAVEEAVAEAKKDKDIEFAEKEKSPRRTYSGPETYGSVQFDYPKTWSIYVAESASGTVLDVYAAPGFVPAAKNKKSYALRLEIKDRPYESELTTTQDLIKTGKLTATAFRPEKVSGVLGLRLDGDIATDKKGSKVMLPIRDKTLIISTEAEQFKGDFDLIIKSLEFVP